MRSLKLLAIGLLLLPLGALAQTANCVPKYTSINPQYVLGCSSATDSGTTYSISEAVTAPSYNATTVTNGYEISGNPVLFYPDSDTTSLSVGSGANASQTAVSQYDVGVGSGALNAATQAASGGLEDTAVGFQALYKNTTGYNNAAFGTYAMFANVTNWDNTAFGNDALASNNATGANFNSAFGQAALNANTSGYNNTAIGQQSLFVNTTGHDNTGLGQNFLSIKT